MTTKITVMYDVPQDPEAFESRYNERMAIVASIPLLQRVETHSVWPTGLPSPALAYRLVELFFEDSVTVRDALGTQVADGFLADVLELGASGMHIMYHDEAS